MLIEFTVGNSRSFRDEKTLSLLEGSLNPRNHAHAQPEIRRSSGDPAVLHSAAVYGANSGGKTNLFRALKTMQQVVVDSAREGQAGDKLPADPFLLHGEFAEEPSTFELVFLHEGSRFRYGFEITADRVVAEWLFWVAEGRRQESRLFERDGQEFKLGPGFRAEGRGLDTRTRKNALFLSVCAQFDGQIASRVLGWFRGTLRLVSGLNDDYLLGVTVSELIDGPSRGEVVAFLRSLDLGLL